MPHCIVEHSETIDCHVLVPLVFAGALQAELFEVDGSDIKVRSLSYSSYQTGISQSDFIHVVLKILSGRTSEQKLKLSQLVLAQLETAGLNNCSITIEVVDIDRASYSKLVR
ncbi:5-carboxymethyl-2-hydroxymuconate isomerase [Thalassotalea sp. 42_200_T64]|nr:5-carboxymethyl-2-hydroxymuconate isomerase [Thalassotalea sp. 42_200_T64]